MYTIIRFYAPHLNKESETMQTGLSLEQAQKHCNDPNTREDGEWFDGYRSEQPQGYKGQPQANLSTVAGLIAAERN